MQCVFLHLSKFSRGRRYRKKSKTQRRYRRIDTNHRLPFSHDVVPVILTPEIKYNSFSNDNFRNLEQSPFRFSHIPNAHRRSGYGGHSRHGGVNSITVSNDGSDVLWPLLGLFGLFQLLTTGAIGNLVQPILLY